MRACVLALNGKQLELSTPNMVRVYFMAGPGHHALRSNGQRSKSQRYEVRCSCIGTHVYMTAQVSSYLSVKRAIFIGPHACSVC